MAQHTLADAFLSKIPKGLIPIVDTLKDFQRMSDDFGEQEKQTKQPQQPAQTNAPVKPPIDVSSLQQQFVQNKGVETGQNFIPQQAQGTPTQPQTDQGGQSNILKNLLRFGIPVGAAIAGTVNPNLLPQASGLATGFSKELVRQEEQKLKLDIATEKKTEKAKKEKQQIDKDAQRAAEKIADIVAKSFPAVSPDTAIRSVAEIKRKILNELPETSGDVRSFNSLEEASAAGLPVGTKFKVGDRTGTIK